jgi:hypothetical protein
MKLPISLAIVGACIGSWAADVALAWDPSPSVNVVGYKILVGTSSGQYQRVLDVGPHLTGTVHDLGHGKWFAVVTAYDHLGLESRPSNEVSFEVPPPTGSQPTPVRQVTARLGGQEFKAEESEIPVDEEAE